MVVKAFIALALFASSVSLSHVSLAKDKVIGIVLDKWEAPTEKSQQEGPYGKHGFYGNKEHYSETIHQLCKGVAVIFIPPVMENIHTYAEIVDGVLIPGLGPDINPKYYNEKETFKTEYDTHRTQFELELVEIFYKQRKPILGICHGMQVINVAFGGKLYQDLPTETESEINHNPYKDGSVIAHEIIIDNERSILTDIVGNDNSFMVNSMHHQGVKTLGDGLSAIATSPDGLTEAIQMKSHPFLVGVQWHPEFKLSKTDRRLIESFCKAVKGEVSQPIQAKLVEKTATKQKEKNVAGKCVNKGPTKECRYK